MPTKRVLYTRLAGKRLTYEIVADDRGRFSISVGGAVVKRGVDPLVERGFRAPGPDVLESTIAHAQVAILYLAGMKEEHNADSAPGRSRRADRRHREE